MTRLKAEPGLRCGCVHGGGAGPAQRGFRFDGDSEDGTDSAPPPPRTKWTRRVPHPVLIGHAASFTPACAGAARAGPAAGCEDGGGRCSRERGPVWFPEQLLDETCPVSTGRTTRRVQLVQERGGSGLVS